MTEKELIGKIRELRQIKPSQDWVSLTKSQILGKDINQHRVLVNLFRPAYAGLIVVFVLLGLFGFAQKSLPGDLLYPIKKITEKSQAIFVSEEERPKLNLELVNKRLEELSKIAEKNEVKKLAPAISEFQANVSEAAKSLTKTKKLNVEKIVAQTKKLEENKKKVEALGVVIGETEELDNALAQLVESQIKDLEGRTLTERQQSLLVEAKEDFEDGNYNQALEKILLLSYPQE